MCIKTTCKFREIFDEEERLKQVIGKEEAKTKVLF